jgi:hypothetical protein
MLEVERPPDRRWSTTAGRRNSMILGELIDARYDERQIEQGRGR